jgi:hypothetical protein
MYIHRNVTQGLPFDYFAIGLNIFISLKPCDF